MKRVKCRVASAIVAGIFILNSGTVVYATSTDSIQSQIDKNKEEMKKIEDKKDEINKQKSEHQKELDGILSKINEEGTKLTAITIEVNKYQADIDKIQAQINEKQEKIKSIQSEVENKKILIKQKEAEEKETQDKLAKRIRSYYKIDITSQYIYMIIKSESLSSLFMNIDNIFRIINMDKDLIQQAKGIQKQLVAENKILDDKIAQIKEEEKVIVAKQNEVKEAQKGYLVKQQEQQKKMDELSALEDNKSSLIASLSDKEKSLISSGEDLLADNGQLEKQLKELLNNINNANNNNNNNSGNSGSGSGSNSGGSSSGGNSSNNNSGTPGDPSQESFLRPGSGVVTDTFGHRINPVTGKQEYHKGVDLGDPQGAPVAAAKSGTVSYAGWMTGYGNLVIIDHGNGVQTFYGHNSSLDVSVGQHVSRGQTIARVGATGQVTGPHIHWEIRVNGEPTDPMPYV